MTQKARPSFPGRRLTLTHRVLALSLAAGLLILLGLDFYIRRQVRMDFQNQLTKQLQIQANEGRLRFDNYVKGHFRLAKIIGGQARFLNYVSNHQFAGHDPTRYTRPPSWLPPLSMLRQLTRVGYFIITDSEGVAREYYCLGKKGLPPSLEKIDPAILRISGNENFMTLLGGKPYILSSVLIDGQNDQGFLLLATEVDDFLLASMLPPYQTGDQIIALVTGFQPTILASSDAVLLPPGTKVDSLVNQYLYFGAKIFNYEYSDLLITYAHFLPKSVINGMAAPVLQRQRLLLIVVAAFFTLFFVSVILWISHQIAVVTRDIATFSTESLGGAAAVESGGNELEVLRDHFRLLADEVRSATRKQAVLLQTVLDAMPAPLFYKDNNGIYQGCNQAFAEFLGKPVEKIVNHTVYDIAPRELADIYYHADNALMETGGKQVYETRIIYADGSEHEVIFHKATFDDEEGNIIGMVGLILDITERNRAERERKEMEAKLVQAQKMESIGTLAGGIAHDFNNILSAIIGYTELALLEAGEKSPLRPHLEVVFNSGNRAKDLVRQILTFSRQTEHEKKPLSLVPIVKETMKMLRASVPSTIEFKTDIETEGSFIHGDPVQLHQIIMNLCTNAYHAMREGGGTLGVSLSRVVIEKPLSAVPADIPPGTWQCLAVTDTGRGMSRDILDRVFEPYFTTKSKGEGTGLGLAVVHGIVMDHQGHISVESKLGVGTTFRLYFPELQHHDEPAYHNGQTHLLTSSGRILVVDDEQPILGMVSGILSAAGYTVTARQDPAEALQDFKNDPHRYDLLITDMTMPGMTGYELATQVLELHPNLPVILCTGYSELINKKEAEAAGINRYFMKPVSSHELTAAVRELLQTRQLAGR